MEPVNWNVVLVGAWNTAIFTPQWVTESLLDLPAGTAIEVQVPMLAGMPIRFIGDSVVVVPADDRLVIDAKVPTQDGLEAALSVARRAIEELPKTPLSAAGFNLRYRSDETPAQTATVLSSTADDALAKSVQVVTARRLGRALAYGAGIVNVTLSDTESGGCLVEFNFHRSSPSCEELANWLTPSWQHAMELVTDVFNAFGVHTKEQSDDK